MRQRNGGFILLEILAFFVMTFVVLSTLAVMYNCFVSIMVRHNMQKDGFEIAQLEMANLEQGSHIIGETTKESAEFEIVTKTEESGALADTNKLEVTIYEKGKTRPLVNLVRYE